MSEKFLAQLLNYLANTYREELILKGGMLLRLYDSPRQTNDLDYAWKKNKSRKILAKDLTKVLEKLEGVQILEVNCNSRGVFIDVIHEPSQQKAAIEINVVKDTYLPPQPLSTARLADPYNLSVEIVSTMALAEAFSHKIAAALERDLVRDLYDLSRFESLTNFDEKTLKARLAKLCIQRAKAKKFSFVQAAVMLKEKLDKLSEARIRTELAQTLEENRLVGLNKIIQASVGRVVQALEVRG